MIHLYSIRTILLRARVISMLDLERNAGYASNDERNCRTLHSSVLIRFKPTIATIASVKHDRAPQWLDEVLVKTFVTFLDA